MKQRLRRLFTCGWLGLLLWLSPLQAEPTFNERQQQMLQKTDQHLDQLNQISPAQRSGTDWLLLAIGYDKKLNKEQAMFAVNQALRQSLPPALHVLALEQKALIYGRLFRDIKMALETLQLAEQAGKALYQSEPTVAAVRLSSVYESFAQALNQQGELDQAEHYVNQSIALALEHQLAAQELPARLIAGRLMLQQNNYTQAQLHFSRALALSQQLQRNDSMGSIHLRLGMAYQKLADYPKAVEHLLLAQQLNQQDNRLSGLLYAHIMLGDVWLSANDVAQAAQQYQQAEQLLDQVQDPFLTAQLTYSKAQLAHSKKLPADAFALAAQAQQLFQQLGNQQLTLESTLTLVNYALAQQQPNAASYLPEIAEPAKLPRYLQLQYWQTRQALAEASQQWPQALAASQRLLALQQEINSRQQRQHLDLLNLQLDHSRLKQQLSTQPHQSPWWVGVTLTLAALLVLGAAIWGWQRQNAAKQAPLLPAQTSVKSWQAFSRQLKKAQQQQPALQLVAIQIAGISEYKLHTGEQRLRRVIRAFIARIQSAALLDHTVHTDVIWLAVVPEQLPLTHIWQALLAQLDDLPGQPVARCWHASLDNLLGRDWPEQSLQGLRELVWRSWADAPPQQHSVSTVRADNQHCCAWQHEQARQDIDNALALGMLQLTQNLLSTAQPDNASDLSLETAELSG